jgi:cysteine desulfurase
MIYLDNAASTPVNSELIKFHSFCSERLYANQEALHSMARETRMELEKAAEILSGSILNKDREFVFWTHSGTDSINAICALPFPENAGIVTTRAEHPALIQALKRTGANIRYAPLRKNGEINIEEFEKKLSHETTLVAIHHVQSETGRIQCLSALRRIINKKAPQALFMSDTVQSAGKLEIPWNEARLDFITVSGHKTGAGAAGAVLCRNRKHMEQLLNTRKKQYLSGRVHPPAVLTLAEAACRHNQNRELNLSTIIALNKYFREQLAESGIEYIETIPEKDSSPYIIHIMLPGYQSAVIVRMLSEAGIMVSAGSACAAETSNPSPALSAMGYGKNESYSGLRISLWHNNTATHAEAFTKALKNALENY